jgi:isochorismate hydrolase
MERAFGLDIPHTLAEVCDPRRTGLLVYDMQVGIVSQISSVATIVQRVDHAAQVKPMFLRESPGFPITPSSCPSQARE